MNGTFDHLNLKIPVDSVEEYVEFYRSLGFETEHLEEYRAGDRPWFYVRFGPTTVVHVSPRESFAPPARDSFDHFAVAVEEPIDAVTARVREAGIGIVEEAVRPGATGTFPNVYVEDPAGYLVEIKALG